MLSITQEQILMLLSAITGFIGIPIIQFIKNKIGLTDSNAMLFAIVSSIVLAFTVVFTQGTLNEFEMTMEAVITASAIVFSVATVFYKVLIAYKK